MPTYHVHLANRAHWMTLAVDAASEEEATDVALAREDVTGAEALEDKYAAAAGFESAGPYRVTTVEVSDSNWTGLVASGPNG